MSSIHRRDLLRFGSTAALLGGFHSLLASRALAGSGGMSSNGKKALIVYLDGAADGISMVFPHADPNYATVRGSLALTESQGIDIGSDVMSLHPSLAALDPILQAGEAAFIQRVGRKNSRRSHFTERLWLHRGGSPFDTEGVFGRFIDLTHPDDSPLPACTIGTRPSVLLEANSRSMPMIAELGTYDMVGVPVGTAPSPSGTDPGSGLLGAYSASSSFSAGFTRIHRDGLALLSSVDYVQANLPGTWPPSGLTYPDTDFGQQVRDAIWTLQQPVCQVAAVRLGGFDTHSDQADRLEPLLEDLAETLAAARAHAGSMWKDMAVLVITEFGRNKANGNGGTDHGKAWCAMAMGGNVEGGIYNGDATTWFDGSQSPLNPTNGYLTHRTDYRTLYADLLQNHLGLPAADLGLVIPDWPLAFDPDHPDQWNQLGLF